MKMVKARHFVSIKYRLLFSSIGLLISIGCGDIQSQSYIKQADSRIVIGNRFLERDFQIKNGIVGTISFKNKLAGQKVPTVSSEFRLVLDYQTEFIELTNKDFQLVRIDKKDLEKGIW